MKSPAFAFFGILLLASPSLGAQVTPVQKVVELLQGMLAKGKEEKHGEQVQFASFKQFCDDTSVEKTRAIAEAEEKIERLTADIEKYTSDAAMLTKEIAAHDEDISVWNGDAKAATKVREIEKADYDALHKDFSESIDALGRAIQVLKQQAYDRKQGAAFTQVSNLMELNLIPKDAKKAINAFLEQGQGDLDESLVAPPEAWGYEFQSHGIIEMLEKLLDKFVGETTQLEKDEMNSNQAFEILIQDLTAEIGQATEDRSEKAETKAKKLEARAAAEADKKDTIATKEEDEKYLSDLTATCTKKTSDFESRQALRADEIVAIEKALEIISSAALAGNADTYLPTLLQLRERRGATSLASLRANTQSRDQERAAMYLKDQAMRLKSRALSAIAARIAEDPFAKVKKMIKDLLVRLMEEANEESDHKAWCDTELSTNEQVRKEKTAAVESLHAQCDQLEASIAKLGEEITELNEAVAALDAAMSKATGIRVEEKATNEQTVKDSQDAQTATSQALTVLKEFYASAGEATALLQGKAKKQPVPEIFETKYTGMQAEGGGVVGMLEVIESDFARLEAETTAAEATAAKEYETFMEDSKADKAQKKKDIEHKTYTKQDETQALTVAKDDLAMTQNELDAALSYFDKLKPSCVEVGVSYDDRVARRKEEIESLQEALKILQGEEIASP
jgi:prefoldin subunit 5